MKENKANIEELKTEANEESKKAEEAKKAELEKLKKEIAEKKIADRASEVTTNAPAIPRIGNPLIPSRWCLRKARETGSDQRRIHARGLDEHAAPGPCGRVHDSVDITCREH